MSKDVDISLPFRAPAGTHGKVRLQVAANHGGKAHLSVDMGHIGGGSTAGAPLNRSDLHQLVDALMEGIYMLERTERLDGNRGRAPSAAQGNHQQRASGANEREAFEAWVISTPSGRGALRLDENNDYWYTETRSEYHGWLARAALTSTTGPTEDGGGNGHDA